MDRRAIVSDIDGTLLSHGRPTEGLGCLSNLIDRYRSTVRLVYATGRTFQSTWERIQKGILPMPDAVAPLVGTEVWFPPWKGPSENYSRFIGVDWNRHAILEIGRSFGSILELQEERFQSPYKVSYYLSDPLAVTAIEERLVTHGVRARMIFSCDLYLDFLPVRAGKNQAADFCRKRWHIPAEKILVCGDSGNDLDMMLDPRKMAVIVGNAENELKRLRESQTVHLSDAPFAAGVVEGAESYHFWPNMDGLTPSTHLISAFAVKDITDGRSNG